MEIHKKNFMSILSGEFETLTKSNIEIKVDFFYFSLFAIPKLIVRFVV